MAEGEAQMMDSLDFAALGVSAIGAIGVGAWVVWQLWKVARKRPMATRLPKPRPDQRDWQGEFRRSIKP